MPHNPTSPSEQIVNEMMATQMMRCLQRRIASLDPTKLPEKTVAMLKEWEMAEKKQAKTICIDLNGVLDMYSGWKGEDHEDFARDGAKEFLMVLHEKGQYRIVILTTRPADKVWAWLKKWGMDKWVDEVTDRKPPALCYVDDRAICFRGDFVQTAGEIETFKAHWEK